MGRNEKQKENLCSKIMEDGNWESPDKFPWSGGLVTRTYTVLNHLARILTRFI